MGENTNRHIFALNGISGMLIATVLLLSILAVLTWLGIMAQKNVMQEPYKIVDPSSIKFNSTQNAKHIQIVKDK